MRAKRIPQTGPAFKTSGSTTLNQDRDHNVANEITDITETTGTAWPTPTHDANGNSTKVPRPLSLGNSFDLKYDAWNRLVEVKNTGGSVVATYAYDGANRRVTFYDGTNTRHYYYSDEWQVLEERLNSASAYDQRFVFGLRYLDDLILRDDGGVRHYCLSDYFSITSIVNTSGTVLERYTYDAFGKPYYWTSGWSSRGSSSYSWETLYASYRYDLESGMYQVRHRYLHPNLGRWISRDPIGEVGFEIGRKSNMEKSDINYVNLYEYVKNNAVNHVDKMGLKITPDDCMKIYKDCMIGVSGIVAGSGINPDPTGATSGLVFGSIWDKWTGTLASGLVSCWKLGSLGHRMTIGGEQAAICANFLDRCVDLMSKPET